MRNIPASAKKEIQRKRGKMGFIKYILLTSVLIGLLSVVLHENYPLSISFLMKNKNVRSATMAIHKFIRDLYPSNEKGEKGPNPVKGSKKHKEKIFTEEELKNYDGKEGRKGPYLAILGRVYNVKKGKQHYGAGGGYEFFSGRDASRAFVSGDFSEAGLVDDVSGLSNPDYIGLDDWVKFYEKDYKYVGKLIGRYYNEQGEPTQYSNLVQQWISEAYAQKEDENQEKRIFPPCNSEWTPEAGSRVWCTTKSGGIQRDWTGVPRKLFSPGQGRSRCACVKNFGAPSHDPNRKPNDNRGDLDNPNIQEYKGCPPEETSCYIKEK